MFQTLFYKPLYNGFVVLFNILPVDAGIIVIVFTILVKFLIYPLSKKSIVAQVEMKKIEPDLKLIREKYKDDKQEQAKKTMDLYRSRNINPFSGIFSILIQFPIIIALYFVFLRSGLPQINESLLYGFVSSPSHIDTNFLGLIDVGAKSLILALFAAITSFFQMKFSTSIQAPIDNTPSFKNDLARSMSIQMRYVLPALLFFVSYSTSGAVALYLTTSNLFTLAQEVFVRKKLTGK
jgi:YidC/Oxa1 family membrane protein insertase